MSKPQDALIALLREAQLLLNRPDNDFSWSSWESANKATTEVAALIYAIDSGKLPSKFDITFLFVVAGPMQEVSLSSGWAYEFLNLAERMDVAIEKVYGRLAT